MGIITLEYLGCHFSASWNLKCVLCYGQELKVGHLIATFNSVFGLCEDGSVHALSLVFRVIAINALKCAPQRINMFIFFKHFSFDSLQSVQMKVAQLAALLYKYKL